MNERDIVLGISVRKASNSLSKIYLFVSHFIDCSCNSRFEIGNFERIFPARIQVDFDSTFKSFLEHVNSQINQVEGRCSLLSEIHQWSEVPSKKIPLLYSL